MKFNETDNKFKATIQNYQEALACLEVASRYLRCGRKPHRQHQSAAARKLRPHRATGSSYAWGTRLGRHHWTAEVDNVEGGSNSCDYSSGSDYSGSERGDIGCSNERLQMDCGNFSRSTSLIETRCSYRLTPSCSNEMLIPKALYANGTCASSRNDDQPRPKTSDRVPDVFCGEDSSDGDVSSEDDVDHAVVTGLVERCSESIAAILAQPDNKSGVIQESLQSLVESLKMHKLMLEKLHSSSSCQFTCGGSKRGGVGAEGRVATSAGEGDREWRAVEAQVSSMRSTPCGEGLEGVVGLEEVKEVLQEAFVWPAQMPHLFQGGALEAWSRLLLYGPPGTGKTRLARALATDLNCSLYTVTPSTLLSSWLGDSEKMVRELFKCLRAEQGPVVVFLDEMDALCRTRTASEDDVTRRIKTELLVHLDSVGAADHQPSRAGAASSSSSSAPDCSGLPYGSDHLTFTASNPNNGAHQPDYVGHPDDCIGASDAPPSADHPAQNRVFIIAATNCPWDVDPAFLRRFQKRCYVPLPESAERRLLLEAGLSGCRCDLTEDDWTAVLAATNGHSGADLTTVATAAAFRPVRQLHSARYWRFTKDNKIEPCSSDTLGAMQYPLDKLPANRVTARPLMVEDLLAAARSTPRSVSATLLQQYKQYALQ